MHVKEQTKWIAKRASGNPIVWTVRGVTEHGVFFTGEVNGFLSSHLLSEQSFRAQYRPA